MKRQRRVNGFDEIVLSVYAIGLTTGEISAHFAQFYGALVSKETVSRFTDKGAFLVCDGLNRLPEMVGNVGPQTTVQGCIIHLIRNTLRLASKGWNTI